MKVQYFYLVLSFLLFSCTKPLEYKEKARFYLKEGNYEDALSNINTAIKIEPDCTENYEIRELIYNKWGRYNEQIRDINKIIELNNRTDKKLIYPYHDLAQAKIKLGLYDEALIDIDFFIDNYNNIDTIVSLSEAYILKGSLFYLMNQYKKAEEYYKLAMLKNIHDSKVIDSQSLVGLSNLKKSNNEAMDLLNKAISIDSNNDIAYGSRGIIYYNLGISDNAYSDLHKAISLNPYESVNYFNMGQLFMNYLNNRDSAIYYFKKAINVSPQVPDNFKNFMNIGVLEHRIGNHDSAFNCFTKALIINPNNDLLFFNFALLLSDMGQNEEALVKINNAIKINSKESDYYDTKGNILFTLSFFEKAENEYLNALKINPNNGSAYYNLGNLYGELNNHERSINFYDKAVNLNFELKTTLVNRALQKIKINKISSACIDLNRAYKLGRTEIKPLMDKYCK